MDYQLESQVRMQIKVLLADAIRIYKRNGYQDCDAKEVSRYAKDLDTLMHPSHNDADDDDADTCEVQ